jgi:shikimate kinase
MAELKTSRHVFIVGFMGSGKTTAGRELARRKGWEFIDLDQVIEQSRGKTVAAIFREQGEAAFREMESSALEELLSSRSHVPHIIALGGGAFAQSANASRIKKAGAKVISLDAPVSELLSRCRQQYQIERPLLKDEEQFRVLYKQRQEHYGAADFRIDTYQRTITQVVDEIEHCLEGPE